MAVYEILFKESVFKDFKSVSKRDLQRILERIEALAENPRLPDSKKIAGQERYRLRQGQYRILYSIQDQELTIWIVKVGHRKNVYR